MKNIYKYIAIVFLFGTLASCEEDLTIFDTEDTFVQLASATGAVGEGDESIISTVLLGAGTNASGVSVSFTVTSADNSRFTVTPASGTIEIPAGENSADIVIAPVDNLLVDGDLDIVVELTTGSALPVGIAGEGMEFASRAITLIDDDCPVDINNFVGVFEVFENFTAGVNSPSGLNNFFGEAYQIELALAPGDATGTKLVLTNSAGFNEYIADGTVITLNACPETITFDAGFPTVALFRTFEYDASSFDDVDAIIQCTGPLSTFGDYQFTFTKM